MDASLRRWIELAGRCAPGASRALVLRLEPGGHEKVIACWPAEARPGEGLVALARGALERGTPVMHRLPDAGAEGAPRGAVALPLGAALGAPAAAAFELVRADPHTAAAALDAVQQAARWLQALGEQRARAGRVSRVLRLVAVCLERERYRDAAAAFATELATELRCERVALGFLRGRRIEVEALSHSAHFDARTRAVQDLRAAMEEAVDQDARLVLPDTAEGQPRVTLAQRALAEAQGLSALCSLPLSGRDGALGALVLERADGTVFSEEALRSTEEIAAAAGPLLAALRRADAGPWTRLREGARRELALLTGPGHAGRKLAAGLGALFLLLAAFLPVPYRVKADATLEGRVQRAIVAGVDGFIAQAEARAGDLVRRGQVLGALDERDLRVEHRRWTARREQLRKEYFEALAAHDRTEVNIARARVDQAEAQIDLLEEQLRRTRLVAPFDGVVVEGDLSQSLGSPVSRGDVLFEVAPLDGYRVILEVDERDVGDVSEGSAGHLTLSALPGRAMPFTVERVTPVATAQDGRNFFRVEARLGEPDESLRPGLEGVAKVASGRRSLGWILLHDLVDWWRLRLWALWP